MNFSGREDLSRRCASKNRINIIFFYDEGASIRLERFADHTSFDSVSLDKRDQNTHFGAVVRCFRPEHCVSSFAVSKPGGRLDLGSQASDRCLATEDVFVKLPGKS